MRILLTGKAGQLGYELAQSLKDTGDIVAVDRAQMDLTDLKKVREIIRTIKPALIINAAAYTDVETAEVESAIAMRVNGEAPAVMAEEAKLLGSAIIHFSSDYVFDGKKTGGYVEEDVATPLNAYGASKLEGELGVRASGAPHLVLRTSWVYSLRGKNFLTTIRKRALERCEFRIVNDQIGAPTWSRTLAVSIRNVLRSAAIGNAFAEWVEEHSGLYHITAQGSTTWFGFAQEVIRSLPDANKPCVVPIDSHEYPSAAVRPKNSILDCSKWISTFGDLPQWDEALRLCMQGERACQNVDDR